MSAKGLGALFQPRAVAVVGASRRPGSIGGAVLANIIRGGFEGTVYPVNDKAAFVSSVRSWPTLASLPEVPDLVVVAVPAKAAVEVVKESARLGVGACAVLTAGFSEVGAAGHSLERELVLAARGSGMRLLGPNCLGLQCSDPRVRLDATFATTFAPDGAVAFASQSGALGLAALDYARDLGLGFSVFASLGNKADVSGNDLLAHFQDDPRTRVVLLYLESLGNPGKFREIAPRFNETKPIALVKGGRSTSGARAAGSHTGALAGPDSAVSALCRQTGTIRADTLEELFDVAIVLANQPLPAGRRVGVVTNAGGPGILAADALETFGLKVPTLTAETQAALRTRLNPAAAVANPVDIIADGSPEEYRFALERVLADPNVDAALAIYVPPITREAPAMAKVIVEASSDRKKPVLSCFMGSHGVPESLRSLQAGHVPSFRFPEGAARALAHVAGHAEWRAAPHPPPAPVAPLPAAAKEALARARARLGSAGGWLDAEERALFARAFELTLVPEERFAPTLEAARAAARKIGFPVVLKAEKAGLIHKTEVGAVIVGIDDEGRLEDAVARLSALAPERFLMQRQLSGGEEWIVGAVRDPVFGPLVAVGSGGARTEIIRDVEQRLAPLSSADLDALVDRPRIGRTLPGWRGMKKRDRPALLRFISQLAAAACAAPEIAELESNPVMVMAEGEGALGVDLRVRIGAAG